MLLCICSVINHRWCQNVVKQISGTLDDSQVCHWCSYHIFMPCVGFKYFEIKKSFICSSLFHYYIKQIDSISRCILFCSAIDHRRCQNAVRTSVTHLAITPCATFLFLPHFDIICDLQRAAWPTMIIIGKIPRRKAMCNKIKRNWGAITCTKVCLQGGVLDGLEISNWKYML